MELAHLRLAEMVLATATIETPKALIELATLAVKSGGEAPTPAMSGDLQQIETRLRAMKRAAEADPPGTLVRVESQWLAEVCALAFIGLAVKDLAARFSDGWAGDYSGGLEG